jgi:hypothetical protein
VVPRHLRPAHPGLACSLPAAAPEPAALTDAEHYTLIYPQSAALIRACGGLPDRLDLGPPEPETVAALVHGTSPDLRAINDHPHRPTAAAA